MKQANSGIAELTVDESMTSPPSYETLVKNGYIVVDANDMVAPVHEKKEKILIWIPLPFQSSHPKCDGDIFFSLSPG